MLRAVTAAAAAPGSCASTANAAVHSGGRRRFSHQESRMGLATRSRPRTVLAGALAAVALATSTVPAVRAAEPGDIDASFSGDGIKLIDFGSDESALAVFADELGQLTIAGTTRSGFDGPRRVALTRLTSDGRFDRSFGVDGRRTLDPTSGYDPPIAWARAPDGTLIVFGRLKSGYYLMRFFDDGRVDRSFGHEGLVAQRVDGEYVVIEDVLVLPSGRIIVLYTISDTSYLHAHLADGTRVMGFGHQGVASAHAAFGSGIVYQRTSQRILIVATDEERRLMLEAFHKDGERDESYGSVGRATIDVGQKAGQEVLWARGATVLPDGGVALVAERDFFYRADVVVGRFSDGGQPDRAFGGGDGWSEVNIGTIDSPRSVVALSSGRLIVIGTIVEDRFGDDPSSDLFIVGLRRDGILWRRFGERGVVRTNFGRPDDRVAGYDAVATGTKLVVVGSARTDMLVARFHLGN